jgi:hypothetical protein
LPSSHATVCVFDHGSYRRTIARRRRLLPTSLTMMVSPTSRHPRWTEPPFAYALCDSAIASLRARARSGERARARHHTRRKRARARLSPRNAHQATRIWSTKPMMLVQPISTLIRVDSPTTYARAPHAEPRLTQR